MFRIALVITLGLKKYPQKNHPCLVVNGRVDKESFVFRDEHGPDYARVYDERIAKQLTALRAGELERHFRSFTIPHRVNWNPHLDDVEVSFLDWHGNLPNRKLAKDRKIELELRPDLENWVKPYSLAEYAEAIERAAKRLALRGVMYYQADEWVGSGFGIRCRMSTGNPVIRDEIDRCIQALKAICDEAEELLASSARKNSVTTFFSFPPAVRTACEQYLLYFGQFLEDLGIKADAELKEVAQRVLFSVTPVDGPAALEQIRQALEVYLRLPNMPDFAAAASRYPDLAVQHLRANILHLQSQLILAKASLQVKEATIEALQIANYQYKQLLSSEQKPKAETEALIGDTVHVTEIEGKGLKIDLPLILRRLKRVFGVDEQRIEGE